MRWKISSKECHQNLTLHCGVALIGACRIHCAVKLGEHMSENLFKLKPENVGNYVLLSNIYAEAGRWDNVAKARAMLKTNS